TIGVFENVTDYGQQLGYFPSSLSESDSYRERVLTASVNQLVGDRWSLGARYRYTDSSLRQNLPELSAAIKDSIKNPPPESVPFLTAPNFTELARRAVQRNDAHLHELGLS